MEFHGRRGERNRYARADLKQVAPEERGVVGTPASHEHDQSRAALVERLGESNDAAALALYHSLKRGRLLLYLFKH